jgi:hypothetical protein
VGSPRARAAEGRLSRALTTRIGGSSFNSYRRRVDDYREKARVQRRPNATGGDLEASRKLGAIRTRVTVFVANLGQATEVIVKNHYLHRGRTMAQLAYWIALDKEPIGVLLFAYPRLSVSFHGYRPMELLELARMWIDPRVQRRCVRGGDGRIHAFAIASCAIGHALRRLRMDWPAKYPHLPEPLAVVSWADISRHEGTVYRAANFVQVGVSGGAGHRSGPRRNGGSYQPHPDYKHLKRTFIYDFRGRRRVNGPAVNEQSELPLG